VADKYIVVTFTNATIVLSIGETVEEVTDSGFLATDRTLSVSLLGDDMLLQVSVYTCHVCHMRRRIHVWHMRRRIHVMTCSSRYLCIHEYLYIHVRKYIYVYICI
jgi:splicing factor 3B subunit 3